MVKCPSSSVSESLSNSSAQSLSRMTPTPLKKSPTNFRAYINENLKSLYVKTNSERKKGIKIRFTIGRREDKTLNAKNILIISKASLLIQLDIFSNNNSRLPAP